MSHSPEPWKVETFPGVPSNEACHIRSANGELLWDDPYAGPELEDLQRIVACVNFLATIPTEVLEAVLKDEKAHPRGSPLAAMRSYIVQWVEYNPSIFGLRFGWGAEVREWSKRHLHRGGGQ